MSDRELKIDFEKLKIEYAGKKLQTKSTKTLAFVAYLYVKKLDSMDSVGILHLNEMSQSKLWQDKTNASLGSSISRYISKLEQNQINVIGYKRKTTGPFKLDIPLSDISVNITKSEILDFIQLDNDYELEEQLFLEDLEIFIRSITNGDVLSNFGILKGDDQENALFYYTDGLKNIKNTDLKSALMLRTYLALHRTGSNNEATNTLKEIISLGTSDAVIKCRALSYLARQYYLSGDNAQLRNYLDQAAFLLPDTQDDICVAANLSLKGYEFRSQVLSFENTNQGNASIMDGAQKSLIFPSKALYLYARSWYYDAMQQVCYNIANTLYKIGNAFSDNDQITIGKNRDQIVSWIELCDLICEKHNVGGDSYLNDLLFASVVFRRDNKIEEAAELVKKAQIKIEKTGNLYEYGISFRQLAIFHMSKNRKDPLVKIYHDMAIEHLTAAGATDAIEHVKNDIPILLSH